MDSQHDLRQLLPQGISRDCDLTRLEAALRPVSLAKGDALLRPGETCTLAGLVGKGCLRVFAPDPDGSERIVYFAPEGWCVTDIDALVSGRPATLGIDALEPTDLWVIDKPLAGPTESVLPDCDRLWRFFEQQALVVLQKRLVGGLRRTAAQRYLEFQALYPGLEARIPQYHVASYLGVSPEFLSKLRKRLNHDGYRKKQSILT